MDLNRYYRQEADLTTVRDRWLRAPDLLRSEEARDLVLLGSALAILRVHTDGATAPLWWLAGLHGIFAIAGLGCLLLALRGPPRGLATGTASFGLMAAVLIALAALVGGALLATHLLKSRLPGIVIGIRATLAMSGLVILLVG